MNLVRKKIFFYILCISVVTNNLYASDDALEQIILDQNYTQEDCAQLYKEIPNLKHFITLDATDSTSSNDEPMYNITTHKKDEITIQAIFASHEKVFDIFKLKVISAIDNKQNFDEVQDPIFRFIKNVSCLQFLFNAHVQCNRDYVGKAVQKEHVQALECFIKAQASLNTPYCNEIPLWHACLQKQNVVMASLLLQAQARTNARGSNDASLLHLSSGLSNNEITQRLIDANLNIDEQDSQGWTPLHYAVVYGSSDSVSLLIQNKADINIQSYKEGFYSTKDTPLSLARQMKKADAIHLLVTAGAEDNKKSDSSCILS